MSIASQANVNVLNGSSACAFDSGKPSGDNELIKSIPGNHLYAPTMDVKDVAPFGAQFAGIPYWWCWGQLSQLYVNNDNVDTKTFMGNNWLANFPAFKDLGSGSLSDQSKVLKLYGAGTDFGITSGANSNNNNSRSYSPSASDRRIPLVGMSETTTIGAFPDSTCWCRNEWGQPVSIPNNAVTAKFGAYIKVPEDDDFRAKNCGGVYTAQWTNLIFPTEYNVNVITVKRPEDSFSFLTGQQAQGLISQQQWSGLAVNAPDAGLENRVRWHDTCNIQSVDYKSTSDHRQFNKVEKEITLASGTNRKLVFNCFFGENQSNIDESSTPTGAIHFYSPFILFFDSNGDLISSGPTSAKLKVTATGAGGFPLFGVTEPSLGYNMREQTGETRFFSQDVKSPFLISCYFDLSSGYEFSADPTVTGAAYASGTLAGKNSGRIDIRWDGVSEEIHLSVNSVVA